MSIQPQLTLTDYAGNKSHLSLSQQPLVGHKVRPAIAKDSPKRPGTKEIKSPCQIPGQSVSLTSIEQDWKHQGPEDSDFLPPAQVPTAPQRMIQCESMTHQARPRRLLTSGSQPAETLISLPK